MKLFPTAKQERQMLADVERVEAHFADRPTMFVFCSDVVPLCDHVKALLAEHKKMRKAIVRIKKKMEDTIQDAANIDAALQTVMRAVGFEAGEKGSWISSQTS